MSNERINTVERELNKYSLSRRMFHISTSIYKKL